MIIVWMKFKHFSELFNAIPAKHFTTLYLSRSRFALIEEDGLGGWIYIYLHYSTILTAHFDHKFPCTK